MNHKLKLFIASLALLTLSARADELAQKGRDIFKANEHAVVTVQIVLKISGSGGGRSFNPTEVKSEATGTVVDPTGLTVLALSTVDPADLYRRMSEEAKIDTEVTDVKILLDDGTEIPAEVVLRDKDLDLAFVRPKTKPASPMSAVDLTKSATTDVLEPIVALNRLNRAAGRAYSASIERIAAVIQKPRTFYIPETGTSATALGCPAFSLNGNIVGLFVMRAISGGETSGRNSRDNITAILIPADDILKGAKQAPEAKGDVEKPGDAKTAKPATDAKPASDAK